MNESTNFEIVHCEVGDDLEIELVYLRLDTKSISIRKLDVPGFGILANLTCQTSDGNVPSD